MSSSTTVPRPDSDEFPPYFGQYIDLVPDGNLLMVLETQLGGTCDALVQLSAETATRRPSAGEWSPLDIAVHLADTERVLAYRAYTFARNAGAELPGVDFEAFAEAAGANARTIDEVAAELHAVRSASLTLFRSLTADQWNHKGIASGSTISVRALAYIIAGHDLHHLPDLQSAAAGTNARG